MATPLHIQGRVISNIPETILLPQCRMSLPAKYPTYVEQGFVWTGAAEELEIHKSQCRKFISKFYAPQRNFALLWGDIPKPQAVFFDMDATIVAEETLVEMAALVGKREEVAEITARAMRGDLDFKTALNQRMDLVRGIRMQQIYELCAALKVAESAPELMADLKSQGIPTYIVSGGFHPMAAYLVDKLGMEGFCANELEVVDGVLSGRLVGDVVDSQGKCDFITKICKHKGFSLSRCIAVGDGANDRIMMQLVGLAVGMQPKPILFEGLDIYLGEHSFEFLRDILKKIVC